MGKILETTINRFDSVTSDIRTKDTRFAAALKHFDVLDYRERLLPRKAFEDDTFDSGLSGSASTEKLTKFLTYGTSLSGTVQFALGINQGGSAPRLFFRESLPNGEWGGDNAGTGTLHEGLFVQYKGKAYAARSGTGLISWALDVSAPLGSSTVDNDAHALTYTDIFQGLVHSKDDILYIPYLTSSGAFIAKYDGSDWTDTAISLPVGAGKIHIAEYGNYILITTQPKFLGGKSFTYLWNRDDSLTTLSEKIDWGTELIEFAEEVEGAIVGVSLIANSAISFSGSGTVLFKFWEGGISGAKQFLVLNAEDITISTSGKQKERGRVYFMMSLKLNGSWHQGVWSIGRSKTGEFTLALEYQLDNDSQVSALVLKGFQLLGDYMIISYTDGGTYKLKLSNDQAVFTDTSIYESVIFNAGDASLQKSLIGATVATAPLPTNGQVVLKYAIDENIGTDTFITIFTNTTDNSISHSAINDLPKEYKELQFRVESTGGSQVTGLSFKEEIIGKRNY